SYLCLRVIDEAERHPLQLHGLRIPVIFESRELDAIPTHPLLKAKGAGADRLHLVAVGAFRRDDYRIAPGKVVEKIAGRLAQADDDRVIIERLDLRDWFEDVFLGIGRFGRACALEAEFHIGSLKTGAIVEGDAFTQLEGVGKAVFRNLPTVRQKRLYLAVAIELHQSF